MANNNPRKLILEVLRKHPEGLTILSIAKLSGLHRHTSTKYIHEMMGAGIIFQRNIGPAKLCYLKEKIEDKKDQEKILKKLEKRRKGGQLKLIVFVILATFLLSETVIFASQNISLLNETNLSRISTINTSPLTASIVSNLTINLDKNEKFENISTNSTPNRTSSILELSDEITNNSSKEIIGNLTSNVTANGTLEQIEIYQEPLFLEPIFDVILDYPIKITRRESINLRANVSNTGSFARNVYLNWILPDGFEMISGNEREFCGNLNTNDTCRSDILVKTNISTVTGMNEIKIVVNYEE